MELAPNSRHDSETDRIGARVGLWDTALKFLSPGPRNDVTDHLVMRLRSNLPTQSNSHPV